MREDKGGNIVIPALLTAAAVYFGVKRKSSVLSVITKQAVDMVVNNEVNSNSVQPHAKVDAEPRLMLTNSSRRKRKRRR
jgi:hypothetical protein